MTHAIRVRRVRLHSTGGNPVALQLALAQQLQYAPLVPADLPSSAILIIRRLAVASGFRAADSASGQWSHEVAQQIRAAVQRASRPLYEYVPHDAESVLFWDAVELLACYTRDVLAGQTRWYWRELFPAAPGDITRERLLAGWHAYPTALPGLLAALAPLEARRAIQHLTPRDLSQTVRLLHAQFRLPDTVFQAQSTDTPAYAEHPTAPWERILPREALAALTPPAAYLLGLCHTLRREPAYAHSAEFARDAARWLEASSAPGSGDRPPTETPDQHAPRDDRTASEHGPAARDITRAPVGEIRIQPDSAPERAAEESAAEPFDTLAAPEGIRTQWGGVFYLLNAVEWLLAATVPDPVAQVNRWELVLALAYDMRAGEDAGDFADPVWTLLHALARHDPERALGQALAQPTQFHVAPEWLAQAGVDTLACRVDVEAGRLRMWAEDWDIVLADVPALAGALDAVIAFYADARVTLRCVEGAISLPPADPTPNAPLTPGLAWWLACIRPLVALRIRVALPDLRATWRAWLHAPAVIQVTHTHIDVRMALDRINPDVRRIGWDVDPGWQPALGYIVYFHFD